MAKAESIPDGTPVFSVQPTPDPPVIDPTSNVKDLVREVIVRMDSLRESERRREESLREAERRLTESEIRAIREIMELRAQHATELTLKESDRINAIRLVDVNAVAIAAERTNQQAQVLASQLATSAEANRSLVATTAASQKQQLDQIITPILDRLTALEKLQYEGKGLSGTIPPSVVEQLAQLQESRYKNEGRSTLSAPLLMTIAALAGGLIIFIVQQLLLH
jgi:hypothetical protein